MRKNPFIQQFKGPNFTLKGPRFPQIWKIQRNPHYENYHSKVKFESRPDNTEKSVIMHDNVTFVETGKDVHWTPCDTKTEQASEPGTIF